MPGTLLDIYCNITSLCSYYYQSHFTNEQEKYNVTEETAQIHIVSKEEDMKLEPGDQIHSCRSILSFFMSVLFSFQHRDFAHVLLDL